ncbi:MAG TPA: hypothetical protein VHS99_24420, partial [Chloroflexota bacterium]|nr:hypothetical protein [Chloroflexota bacterium]
YALTADGRRVMQLGLRDGAERQLADVAGEALSLAVTADRLYVPLGTGNVVRVLDRQRGELVGTATVGRHPVSILAWPPASPSAGPASSSSGGHAGE